LSRRLPTIYEINLEQTMRIRTRTHTHTVLDFEGIELELAFEPHCNDDILVEHVGDKAIVVAYLVLNLDAGDSPIEDGTANGDIYTRAELRNHIDTDDSSMVHSALGVDHNGLFNDERKITVNGQKAPIRSHAIDEFMRDEGGKDLARDCVEAGFCGDDVDLDDEDLYVKCFDDIWSAMNNDGFKEIETHTIMKRLFMENWREVAGPYVVPISYFSERGSTTVSPTTWDGDPDDLPDGVWVADEDAMKNLGPANATDFETRRDTYVGAVLKEYSSWASGYVYGCVSQIFAKGEDGSWEEKDQPDSCWGFIGYD